MSEEVSTKDKMVAAVFPALLSAVVVIVGFVIQSDQFDKKFAQEQAATKEARQQFQKRFDADQKQWREKLDADQKTFVVGFQNALEQSDRQRANEFRLKYYEHQIAFFSEFCKRIARITGAKKMADVQEDIEQFNQSLIAMVPLFGDEQMQNLSVKFHREIVKLDPKVGQTNETFLKLKDISFALSMNCRDLMSNA